MEAIEKALTLPILQKTLATLPETLYATYDRILQNIDETYLDYAVKAFKLLVFSKRPLCIEEVAEAITIEGDPPRFKSENRLASVNDVIEVCSGMITLVDVSETSGLETSTTAFSQDYLPFNPSNELRLAHYSVQEYFKSDEIKVGSASQFSMIESQAHESIMMSCIGYLMSSTSATTSRAAEGYDKHTIDTLSSPPRGFQYDYLVYTNNSRGFKHLYEVFDEFWQPTWTALPGAAPWNGDRYFQVPYSKAHDCSKLRDIWPFWKYSATFWFEHFKNAVRSNGVTPSSLNAVVEFISSNAVAQNWTPFFKPSWTGFCIAIPQLLPQPYPVFFATLFGLPVATVKELIRRSEKPRDLRNEAADHIRSAYGLYMESADCYLALLVAISFENRPLVRALFEHGVSPTGYNPYHRFAEQYALELAARFESLDLVREVIAAGSGPASQCSIATFQAIRGGQLETVKYLLDSGASHELQKGTLPIACFRGLEKIVELLLDAGADVNGTSKDYGDYGSPLQSASIIGHVRIVRLLLKYGANVNLRNRAPRFRDSSPLLCAQDTGRLDIMKILIQAGADVNEVCSVGEEAGLTLLMCASQHKQIDVLSILLRAGANVNARTRIGKTALYFAAGSGCAQAVTMLLENGATVNTTVPFIGTPLILACSSGEVDVVKKLIYAGADVNAKIGGYPGNESYDGALVDFEDDAMRTAERCDDSEMIAILRLAGASETQTCSPAMSAIQPLWPQGLTPPNLIGRARWR